MMPGGQSSDQDLGDESSDTRKGHVNNPSGKNQYKDRPPPDDPRLADILRAYHREGLTDRKVLRKLLQEEHGISLGETTIARRKRDLGLRASHLTTLQLSDDVKRQLVLDQMAKDPTGKIGPRTVKKGILADTGINLTRPVADANPVISDWIIEEMRSLDPDGYAARGPKHSKARRRQRLDQAAAAANAADEEGGIPLQPVAGPSSLAGPSRAQSRLHHTDDPSTSLSTLTLSQPTPTPSQQPPPLTFVFELVEPPNSRSIVLDDEDDDEDDDNGDYDMGSYSGEFSITPFDPHPPPPLPSPLQNYSLRQSTLPSGSSSFLTSPPRHQTTSQHHSHSSSSSYTLNLPEQPFSVNLSIPHHPPHNPPPPPSSSTRTPSSSLSEALTMIKRVTPQMTELTQYLKGVVVEPGDDSASAGDVLRCMEAAAMLERQLARLASGMR